MIATGPPEESFRLANYTRGITAGWPECDVERAIVCGLPRRFHDAPRDAQRRALGERPPITHTKWDALLAAVVEHLAGLHGHRVPEWVHEAERFLDRPWVLAKTPLIRLESLMYAPAAFLRHGAIPDPRDLDERGGERHEWIP